MTPTVSPARPEECPDLTRIAHAAKAHWGYPAEWLRRWAPQLTIEPAALLRHEVRVLRDEAGRPRGFYALGRVGDEATLEHLWLDPAMIGRGFGRVLYQDAIAHARALGASRLTIESDPFAEGFYRRMGAVPIGRVAAHLDDTERWLPLLEVRL